MLFSRIFNFPFSPKTLFYADILFAHSTNSFVEVVKPINAGPMQLSIREWDGEGQEIEH